MEGDYTFIMLDNKHTSRLKQYPDPSSCLLYTYPCVSRVKQEAVMPPTRCAEMQWTQEEFCLYRRHLEEARTKTCRSQEESIREKQSVVANAVEK